MPGPIPQVRVYDINGTQETMPPMPIITTRAPTVNDFKTPGTIWINKDAAKVYILSKDVGGVATWLILL